MTFQTRRLFVACMTVAVFLCNGVSHAASKIPDPFLLEVPPGGKGPLLVMFSGNSGPIGPTVAQAKRYAKAGYLVALFNTRTFYSLPFPPDTETTRQLVHDLIDGLLKRADVVSTKAVVVGYSLGGRVALEFANRLPDVVASATAYFPPTVFSGDPVVFLSKPKVAVPTLYLQGDNDYQQFKCCTVENARALIAATMKPEINAPIEFHEYPRAKHAFNMNLEHLAEFSPRDHDNSAYIPDYDEDSFKRTLEFFKRTTSDLPNKSDKTSN